VPEFTFVTYEGLPDLDPDDRLAVAALADRGLTVRASVWNDPGVDWSAAGICVVRSTWDYHLHHRRFLDWAQGADAVAGGLWNPLGVLRWNAHKSYMRDLAERGAPVVPTAWIGAGSHADVAALLRDRGWDRAVVKPAIGLATRGVMAVDSTPAGLVRAQAHVDSLLAEHDVMVQPFVSSVERIGERALVFIGGKYSHAASKVAFQPLAPAGEAGERPAAADADEIAVATAVCGMVDGELLYARVDLVRGDDGSPLVIEFELVEPSLFLGMHPDAPARFADALSKLM
jgi:glutathione synthase/RimK-type ligase-like ATP-grasp enzyme